ncbi:alpha/beta hydrolase [Litchfieldella rifensis]|uniref:Alpha/beta hydrolase n=1 Tax=Litchfieldella rifensis TaxID=762643 RepID=A0ABV7LJB6_9GAMM
MLRVLLVIVITALVGNSHAADREATVCGPLKERFFFWQWSLAAPNPNPARVAGLEHVEATTFVTGDGKRLAGYRYAAHGEGTDDGEPRGYLLMAMGNAMVADMMIQRLGEFAAAGFDTYVFDYRGYGDSQGRRRINAIIEDYKEIVTALNERYRHRLLYGTSLGGAVMMNVIGSGVDFDRAVIDSSPSRFSPYGCPRRIDPVEHLPDDASRLLVITGQRDSVLGARMTRELRLEAEKRGAMVIDGEDYGHPFMDRSDVHRERMERIERFLLADASS